MNRQSSCRHRSGCRDRRRATGVARAGRRAGASRRARLDQFPVVGQAPGAGPFLIGVKALYNFEFDIAGEAFRGVQKADPAFALGVLGRGDELQPSAVGRTGPGPPQGAREWRRHPARAAKAPAGKERELIEAADVLSAPATSSRATSPIRRRWPHAREVAQDHEVAVMYALSLLGTARPGEKSTRNAMQAASIALDVFKRIRSIRAPRTSSSTPSTIRSRDPRAAGGPRLREDCAVGGARAAYAVAHLRPARNVGRRHHIEHRRLQGRRRSRRQEKPPARPRRLPHAGWLQYAVSAGGQVRRGAECVDQAKAVADKNADNPRIRDG